MALYALTSALRSLSLTSPAIPARLPTLLPAAQIRNQLPSALVLPSRRPVHMSVDLHAKFVSWKSRTKYTVKPVKMRKSGGRDHTGRIRVHGIGGGHKQNYRMIDFLRFRPQKETKPEPFEEKVVIVRYDPCRSADIALVAGGSRKRWIVATENMKAGDTILNSNHIGRMAVAAKEGDAHPLGALPVGTLINNVESEPGRGAQYIRAAGTCGVLLRKVNGTAIIQLPSKRQMQVLETCTATVGRVSNVNHNQRVIGKAGRNRWLGKRPNSGLWQRKGGWAGRKIRPLPPMKSYVKLPSVAAQS
ncbi:39S ribosomal protein L2, mitochondrial isoform X1 [Peromyscus californicus insignis]|uniref:39S ribosomal protein L2, mitochondrial isoform X1 n=2 Tax=Peromyscus californicus insignis TaxID=564181 RepID=UPI0022A6F7E7|nr:39S ribosomal protein L2, mitochondrial isoform X1 [Peromyscus californicus insignis]